MGGAAVAAHLDGSVPHLRPPLSSTASVVNSVVSACLRGEIHVAVTSNLFPITHVSGPSGSLQEETVTAVQVHTVYSLRDVTIVDASGATETIDTTDSHPFYVQGQGFPIIRSCGTSGFSASMPQGGLVIFWPGKRCQRRTARRKPWWGRQA